MTGENCTADYTGASALQFSERQTRVEWWVMQGLNLRPLPCEGWCASKPEGRSEGNGRPARPWRGLLGSKLHQICTGSAVALALTACGGGSTAPTVAPVVLFVGDSTQQGHLTVAGIPDPPAAVAARLMPGAIVINDAIGATSADQMLAGTDGSGMPWPARVRGASIVSILHGMNGLDSGAQHAAVLRQLVTQARAEGVAVVLETPNPMIANGENAIGRDMGKFLERVQAVRDVAAEMSVPLCDHFAAITKAGMDNLTAIPDGVHPGLAVYKLMGEQDAACIGPMLVRR